MICDLAKHVGFTGSRTGITDRQIIAITRILLAHPYEWLHHGDCFGSDQRVHDLAVHYNIKTIIHPPIVNKLRAYCVGDEVHAPKDYIERNHDIVDSVGNLIGAPKEYTEQLRSGTWATIRYALKTGRLVSIVYPNGNTSFRAY